MKKIILSIIVCSFFIGCGHAPNTKIKHEAAVSPTDRENSQRRTLKLLTLQTIIPMYQQFYDRSALLHQDISTFCSNPDQEHFKQVRNRWGQTLSAWLQTDALLFGPAIEEQIDFSIYFYPIKKSIIKKILNAQENITVAQVKQAGIAGQGLATMEYLLFDRNLSIKKAFMNFHSQPGKRRCNYLNAVAVLLKERAKTIYNGWRNVQGNYADAVSRAGLDSLIYTEVQQPWAEITNKIFQSAEKISSNRLAVPLGKKSDSHPKPYKLEAWRSGHTLANIQASLQGLEKLFSGGLLSWLNQNGHQTVSKKLTLALADLNKEKLPDSDIFHLLQTNSNAIEPFYKKTKVLTQIIKYDFSEAMGVQLGFNDNDGD